MLDELINSVLGTEDAPSSDLELVEAIESEINRRTGGAVSNLIVKAKYGRIFVRGIVAAEYLRRLAFRATLSAIGTRDIDLVDVRITVRSNRSGQVAM